MRKSTVKKLKWLALILVIAAVALNIAQHETDEGALLVSLFVGLFALAAVLL